MFVLRNFIKKVINFNDKIKFSILCFSKSSKWIQFYEYFKKD